MRTRITLSLILSMLLSTQAQAALCSRILTFGDGNILTASQLNSEFNNNVDCVNSISDANITGGASILPSKLSASIAGDGIKRDSGSGVLSVDADDASVEFIAEVLQIKNLGVTTSKINDNAVTSSKIDVAVAGNGLSGGGGSDLSVNVDNSTMELNADALRVKDSGITQAKLAARTTGTTVGAGGVAISNSSGTFTTTSSSFTDVTNLSINITTLGRPVSFSLTPDGSGTESRFGVVGNNDNPDMWVRVTRDGTEIAQWFIAYDYNASASVVFNIPVGGINGLDIVGAGTYNYKVQMKVFNNGFIIDTGEMSRVKLLAYEL